LAKYRQYQKVFASGLVGEIQVVGFFFFKISEYLNILGMKYTDQEVNFRVMLQEKDAQKLEICKLRNEALAKDREMEQVFKEIKF
jgi:hypothetical protein